MSTAADNQIAPARKRYLFYIEGLNREVWQEATSDREAHRLIWEGLLPDQQDRTASIDWVDTEDITIPA